MRARRDEPPAAGPRARLEIFDPDVDPETADNDPPALPARRPFARVPHDFVSHDDLTAGELRVYAILLRFSRGKGVCWPGNRAIGRLLGGRGRHPRHIGRVLKALEDKGFVSREAVEPGGANPTGRLIRIPEEIGQGQTPAHPEPPPPKGGTRQARTPPPRQARTEGESGIEEEPKTLNVGGSAAAADGGRRPTVVPPTSGDDPSTSTTEGTDRPLEPMPATAAVPEPTAPEPTPGDFAAAIADCEAELARLVAKAGGSAERAERHRGWGPVYRLYRVQLVRLRAGDRGALIAEPARVRPQPAPPPASIPPAPRPRAAPAAKSGFAVRREDRAEVHRLIGRLREDGTDVCASLAGRLASLFRDADRETSLRTYLGLAREARVGTGAVSQGLLGEALDRACGSGVRCRGSAFVAAVRALKSEWYRRRASRRASPGLVAGAARC